MDDKFAFLQPWQNAIRECKALHDRLDVMDTREFRAYQMPVHATVHCWPSLPKGYEQLAGRCSIPVPFPANGAFRCDRKRLQRIREALELFNVLATVSRPVFLQLLAEFVVVADHFDDLFTSDLIFVHPVWECYLVGTLNSETVVATWGELFGCEMNPMQYSEEFRAAMEKLEGLRREVVGMFEGFIGRQATVEWCDPSIVIEWTAEHVAIPTKGVQVVTISNEVLSIANSLPSRLDAVFKTDVPEVVQLCAVTDPEKIMKAWEKLPLNTAPQTVETMKPRFSGRGVSELTVALSRMNLNSLLLNLDEVEDSMASSEACVNAGVLLTSLVCGHSLCVGSWEESYAPSLGRRGNVKHLEIAFARSSLVGPAGICSAIVKSSSIEILTVNMGVLGDEFWWLNQARWGWLAYALWSSESNTSIQSAKITNIHLSRSAVVSISLALTNCYPPSILSQATLETSSFGFVDVQRDTKLQPCGVNGTGNYSVMMPSSCRCRARYNPEEMGNQAEVVIAGYGVYTLQLGDGTNEYIPDTMKLRSKANQSPSVHTLTLEFFQVENSTLVTNLLSLIGSNLRSLKMGMYWTGRRCSLLLDRVAAACPRLEELYLIDFDVTLSPTKELRNWGLKKLMIQSCEEVAGLAECLSDPANRMSSKLKELEIRIPRSNQIIAAYVDALTSHDGEYIAVMKEELPLECKGAMISVVECGDREGSRTNDVKAVHRLNETLLNSIFAFAAAPMRRNVRVVLM